MIKSYLKIAFRNLTKNRTFSIINIAGLAVGTICCLYMVMYVIDQYSYDRQHNRTEDIYRINSLLTIQGEARKNATGSPPIAPAMKRDFAEVEQFTRVVPTNHLGAKQHVLTYKGVSITETEAAFVDSTFFDVFRYHFVYGNPSNALAAPYTVVLPAGTAQKLFGTTDPVDKIIEITNGYGKNNFRVTGVVDERLGKSHIGTSILMAMNSGGMGSFTYENNAWATYNYVSAYVRLRHDANVEALEKKLPAFLQKYGAAEFKERNIRKELQLAPVTALHTTGGYANEMTTPTDKAFLNRLLLIALLILVMACVNFMNLSTARAARRAKEVGVRKVIGARINDIVKQFLGEALLLSLLGMGIALPLLFLLLPYLNNITNADVHFHTLLNYRFALLIPGFVVLTGLLAGSYPAFYLSAFRPVSVLKGNFSSRLSSVGIRRFLIVFQFGLSIVFVSGIIIMARQLNYLKNKDIGFEKAQRLVFSFHTDEDKKKIPVFMNDLRQLADVQAVSQADNYPSQKVSHDWTYYLEGSNGTVGKDVQFIFTDEQYLKALGITIAGGRDFRTGDSGRALINETFAHDLGLTAATAPGKRLESEHAEGEPVTYVEIAGVMKDYNNNSLHEGVKPLMLRYNIEYANNNVIASTNSNNYPALVAKMSTVWQRHFPAVPFAYSFLDEDVQKQYEADITLSRIINSFTLVAIFISCLGLFGLSTFMAEQRKKEIGIRKVLGANLASLTSLLSGDFLKLAGIAFLLAVPIAWWAMDRWLQTFAYRISPEWWAFALAGLLVALISLGTVSIQAVRAARANPINSLKAD